MHISKLAMEVKIISQETIKPSSSTPQHLRTYSLSLLDQIAPPQYIPVVLFYSPPASDAGKISHLLKQSLSQAVTHFYPLAGRIKDPVHSVDCNDNGVSYTEASVIGSMSVLIQESDAQHHVQKLLPCDPYEILPDITSQEFLKAQVNYFECGGIAISVCMWHLIGDGYTAASFVKFWAAIAYGGDDCCDEIGDVVFDRPSLFPPQDIKSLLWRNPNPEGPGSNILTKRLVFDGSKLSALREEVGKGPYLDHPTRFEAVIALIWKAVMAATGTDYITAVAVELRKRIDPPFPKHCIGNIVHVTFAVNHSSEDHYNVFAGKLHESIKMIDNEYVRKSHAGGGYFKHVQQVVADGKTDNPDLLRILAISSWCRFPFYEADFGWGKPIWVIPALVSQGICLLDTKDGLGIEAWIGLPKESVPIFEQNPDICTYASFSTPSAFSTN